jgi:hypothetical protein
MKLEPFSIESIFEKNCDVIKDWLCEDQIYQAAHLEIRSPRFLAQGEEGAFHENAAMVSHWEDMTEELMTQGLASWSKLKEFYAANQQVIMESFLSNCDFRKLYAALAEDYEIESSMVCIGAYALHHWSFGYWHRSMRLEHNSEKQ